MPFFASGMKYVPLMKYVYFAFAVFANARDSSQKSRFSEPSNARSTNCGGRSELCALPAEAGASAPSSLAAPLQPTTVRRATAASGPRKRRRDMARLEHGVCQG